MDEALYWILTQDAAVAAKVGDRVYPLELPNGTVPAVTYGVQTENRSNHFAGQSALLEAVYQIDSWGADYPAARDLAASVRQALNNYSGVAESVTIHRITALDRIDIYEEAVERYRSTGVFSIWYLEA